MRLLLPLLLVLSLATPAQARREDSYRYPMSRIWTTAVRFFRIDMECPITEKDREEGYFLFEYPDGSKRHPGSLQVMEIDRDGQKHVRVIIQIAAMPSYIERMILDKLERKLRDEHGREPVPRPKPKPAEPEPAPLEPDEGEKQPKQPAEGGPPAEGGEETKKS